MQNNFASPSLTNLNTIKFAREQNPTYSEVAISQFKYIYYKLYCEKKKLEAISLIPKAHLYTDIPNDFLLPNLLL